jgi:hypothetical protein
MDVPRGGARLDGTASVWPDSRRSRGHGVPDPKGALSSPPPNDLDCPSCRKPIKHGTPDVLKGGQTLHLRCWTLMLRGRMTALDRNRIARAGARDRQFQAEADDPQVPPGATTPGPS